MTDTSANPDPSQGGHPPGPPARSEPRPAPKAVLCPYCGSVSRDHRRCEKCRGYFDHLSRQATQNAMGPWFIRDEANPFRPGCSYETLRELVAKGRVTAETVIRGPTTRQFWSTAGRTPSVANLLGRCHNCSAQVEPSAGACPGCGASFAPETDRQYMGLMSVRLLPGKASPEQIAESAFGTAGSGARRADPGAGGGGAAPSPRPRPAVPTPFEAQDWGSSEEAPRGSRGGAKLLLAVLIPLALAAVVVGGYLLYERTDLGRGGVAMEVPEDRVASEGPGQAEAPTAEQVPQEPAQAAAAEEPEVEDEPVEAVVARIRELLAAGDSESLAEAESLLEGLGPGPERSGLEAAVRERADQVRRRALP